MAKGWFRDLFLSRPLGSSRRAETAGASAEQGSPVFLTPAAIASFPVACAVVKAVPYLLHQLDAGIPDNKWSLLITALPIGFVIFWQNVSGSNKPKDLGTWIQLTVIGCVNTLFLWAVAYGVNLSELWKAIGS